MYKLTHHAAAELLQEHREELHGYLVRQLRCPEIASDILQDTFLSSNQVRPFLNKFIKTLFFMASSINGKIIAHLVSCFQIKWTHWFYVQIHR